MAPANFTKAAGAKAALALVVLIGMLLGSPPGRAQDTTDDAARIKEGFATAPVPLNLKGLNRAQVALVGLGSYFVNDANDCNFCHTAGGPPNSNWAAGHNPYFLHQAEKKTDPKTYLAGGGNFFTVLPVNVPPGLGYGSYLGPNIITRNLTPDKNGLAEGGHTLAQFREILRTGVDLDHIHPTCKSISDPNVKKGICIPPPVDGSRLQVMPWPDFQDMTDNDIAAIYQYLSSIPCIDNKTSTPPAGAPNELRNNCK
jgi:hypothetical protein